MARTERAKSRTELGAGPGRRCGPRCGEIIALELPDMDLKRGYLTVRRSECEGLVSSPKGRRDGKIRLTARLKAALQESWHLRADRALCRDDGFPGVTQVLLGRCAGLSDELG